MKDADFTMNGMKFKELISFKCPFCEGGKVIVCEPMSVLHTMPMCKKYEVEDALIFLRNARLATVGPVADDDQWPLDDDSKVKP